MRLSAIALAALALAGCTLPEFDREEEVRSGPLVFCGPGLERLPCRAGVEEGIPYRYEIYTHCGLGWSVYFDGRYWFAEGPRYPRGWRELMVRGTMTLESDAVAVFRSRAGREARFKPAPATYRPPGCD